MDKMDKLLPHNQAAEESVLGSVLIDPDAMLHIAALRPDDFYVQRNGQLYDAILSLHERREPIDVLTVCDELERRGQLEGVGGAARVTELINAVPTALHIESYARIVLDASFRRRLLGVASNIARVAYLDVSSEEAASEVGRIVTEVLDDERSHGRKTAREVADAVYSEAEQYLRDPLSSGDVRWMSTGWPDLDRHLGGLRAGLYVVYGVPHTGKSWFALHVAQAAASLGKRVMFFSLEMTAEHLVRRMCMAHARVRSDSYERGDMTPDQFAAFVERAADVAERWDMVFDDTSESIWEIVAAIYREHRSKRLDLVVVDYLGLVECPRSENRNLQVGGLTRKLKLLSRAIGAPILVPHQISDKQIAARADKRPQVSDGYESGHISQDADVILGLYRPGLYNDVQQNLLNVIVLKDRLSGSTGRVACLFFDDYGRMLPAADTRVVLAGGDGGDGGDGEDAERWYKFD
jgi:replicative DNA helicase